MFTSKSRNMVNNAICCFAISIQRITPTLSNQNIIATKLRAFVQKVIAIRFFFVEQVRYLLWGIGNCFGAWYKRL
jgi:hypothetical protein